jgi:DNA-binding Xre family transcriptional regulator
MKTFKLKIEGQYFKLWVTKNRRITYKELAHLLGISVTKLYYYKSGKAKSITLELLYAMCVLFECTPNDLLVESELEK